MLVPLPVQHQIAQKAPLVAYVPARLGIGWRYSKWSMGEFGALNIVFTNKAGREIVFVAARFKGNCRAGMTKSFQLDGNKVYWSQTATEQQAWRCVNGMKLVATTSLPPNRFADVGLGIMAASGHRIRA
jgi:hypothetical protein